MGGSSHFRRRCPILSVAIIALLICGGCGSGRIPLSGKVTLDGKPVESGSITLEPVDRDGPTTGGTIADGNYQLVGDAAPLPGKKTVRIIGVRKTGRKVSAQMPFPPGTMIDEIKPCIPKIYNAESTLTCEVSRDGSRQIDFAVKSQ